MRVQHTPGPWACDMDEVGGSIQVYPEGHFLEPWIADVKCEHVGPSSRDEIAANAHLIVGAPDLLAALNAVPFPSTMGTAREHYERFYTWYHDVAQPAIKRAEGQS